MENKILSRPLKTWLTVVLIMACLLAACKKDRGEGHRTPLLEAGYMPGVLDEFRILLGEGVAGV
ncbi:hypothetical protein [Paraflavitalea sp. CAU 1676]|uniref:hypothetical protein n=1 Tax=Paraflavitalea sp. CAU 1676 TaxID=3032598 RepID=UPI0023DC2EDF|nr:hypothetical protein [Paraflavitalea sp. CAU 1676]MDF2193617.1 hypothetical protein [Paraflavitalea sp. CAU 1676]